jgi:Icc protein
MPDNTHAAAPAVLLQVTDPHLHAAADSKMRGVNTFETFLAVLQHVRSDSRWPPQAIVATGDLVQDESRAGYERFKACLGSLGVPVYCVPGNHDDPALMHAVLSEPPFQVCGETTLGAWRLIFLNTHVGGDDAGTIGPAALADLDSGLSGDTERPTLICLHHQPVPMGSAWLDGVGLTDAAAFLEIIGRHSQVRGVVWGHVHQALDEQRGDLRLLSTPSTCAQFLPKNEHFALDSLPPGCRWIELYPDGRIETSVDWVDNMD